LGGQFITFLPIRGLQAGSLRPLEAMSEETLTRRDLPHWYVPGAAHFVTYRLAGTIPQSVLRQWQNVRDQLLKRMPRTGSSTREHRLRVHKQMFAKYDRYLDAHTGAGWLADPGAAGVVRENLYHHHESKYYLMAYCVMPNHVHVLLQPIDRGRKLPACRPEAAYGQDKGAAARNLDQVPNEDSLRMPLSACGREMPDARSPLANIMHSLKSYTANRANELLKRTGQFWQHESYDHRVRDNNELERVVDYVRFNPVKAGPCEQPHDWRFCSAFDRFTADGGRYNKRLAFGVDSVLVGDWNRFRDRQ
jgi:putative DNA methylase